MGGGLAETDCDSGADHWGGSPGHLAKAIQVGQLVHSREESAWNVRDHRDVRRREKSGEETPGSPWVSHQHQDHHGWSMPREGIQRSCPGHPSYGGHQESGEECTERKRRLRLPHPGAQREPSCQMLAVDDARDRNDHVPTNTATDLTQLPLTKCSQWQDSIGK